MMIIVIGVSGSGKTTIGSLLAQELGLRFLDADDFHPKENIAKMSQSIPLTDDDRQPWLIKLNQTLQDLGKTRTVLACSALKESYRKTLSEGVSQIKWVYLEGSYETIKSRIQSRENHFMQSDLLKSQFEALEIPEYGLHINIEDKPSNLVQQIKTKLMQQQSEIGIIGLGVMGSSLALNILDKGISLSAYNRTSEGEEHLLQNFSNKTNDDHAVLATSDVAEFVDSIKSPRKIILMIKAGKAIDSVIESILPLLDPQDILIDGGNSYYKDTRQRQESLNSHEIHYLGMGVSGGEEGARYGPSMMVGGSPEAYLQVQPILESIAAIGSDGSPCCGYVSLDGAGHFVKMIHNGIEYAEMQLLAEVYDLLRPNFSNPEISNLLAEWNTGEESSFLLSCTADILKHRTEDKFTIDLIKDEASNKGTGGWSGKSALDYGVSATMMVAAVFARYESSSKSSRVALYNQVKRQKQLAEINLDVLKQAYSAARLINHHQGFSVISAASDRYAWNIDLSKLASIWTNGCILRSKLMTRLSTTFRQHKALLESRRLIDEVNKKETSLKQVIHWGMESAVPTPCFTAALNSWLTMSTAHLPANLIQAQRDYFGAHTYKRIDGEDGESHHTNWQE